MHEIDANHHNMRTVYIMERTSMLLLCTLIVSLTARWTHAFVPPTLPAVSTSMATPLPMITTTRQPRSSSSSSLPFSTIRRSRSILAPLHAKTTVDAGENATMAMTTADAVHENGETNDATTTEDATVQLLLVEEEATTTSTTSTTTTTTTLTHENNHPLIQWLQDHVFMGIALTPEIAAICTVYFVQGALGLARLAKTYLLKDELNLGPAELSALTGAFALPWTIKPLYGFLTDGFPLWGYRRKTYLMAAGVLGSASYALLSWSTLWDALPKEVAISGTVVTILLASACVAMSDVVTDGIVVTRTRQSKDPAVAGGLQSLCWGASATGSLLSAYFSGSLLESMSVRAVFGLTAFLPLLVALIALQVEEKPIVHKSIPLDDTLDVSKQENDNDDDDEAFAPGGIKQQATALWEAFKQESIWKPALFLFLWQSTPTADGAFFYFLSNDLGLGPEFMGRVTLVTSVSTLVGVVLYNQYLKRVAIRDILYWSTIISVPLGLIPVLLVTHANQALGIPDQALIYGDDVVLAALGEIAFLPTLVLAARLCPPGIEAVLFATLMSIFNGASTVGTELGAGLTKVFGITESNFDNLAALLVFCNLTSLYPLVFIKWLDRIGESEGDEGGNDGAVDVPAEAVED